MAIFWAIIQARQIKAVVFIVIKAPLLLNAKYSVVDNR